MRRQGEREPLSNHAKKDDAVAAGRAAAERESAELVIKKPRRDDRAEGLPRSRRATCRAEPLAGARAMPYDIALARVVEQVPAPGALEGECRYEPKWDGYLH